MNDETRKRWIDFGVAIQLAIMMDGDAMVKRTVDHRSGSVNYQFNDRSINILLCEDDLFRGFVL